jgi:CHAT domain-containing protein
MQPRNCDQSARRLHRLWLVLDISLLIVVTACILSCAVRGNPQAAFDRAFQAFKHGDMAMAAKQADQGYKDFGRAGPEWAWKFTILKARIMSSQGRSSGVLPLLASEPSPPPEGDLTVQKLRLEGVVHASMHNFPEAEQKLQKAGLLCAASNYQSCADIPRARGVMEMQRGHLSEAENFFAQALAAAHASGDQFLESTAYLNLSWSADKQTHFDEALDWADAARRIAVPYDFADVAQTALGNMAWAYYKLGDVEKAEGLFNDAENEARKLGDVISEVGWLEARGYAYMDEGDLRLAQDAFRQSLQLAQQINSGDEILNSLIALAFVSEQTAKLDDAKRYAEQALAMARADGNGRDLVYPLLVEGRVAADTHDTVGAETDFREVAKSPDTPVFLKWEAERSLARLYEDEKKSATAATEYRTALSTFEAARCDLHQRVDSRLPFLSNAARIYEDYIHFLVEQGKTNDALRVADYSRARTLAEGLGRPCKPTFAPDPLNATEIARRAGGTILFYALGSQHSYLWAITPHQVRMFPLVANESEIDAAVQSYRKKLEGPPAILDASNDGSVLYKLLVEPAQDLLKQEARAKSINIFIIPDGGLNSLNFETLLPQPQHYWIEDVTISNAASLRLLPAVRTSPENLGGKLLLIGDPKAPAAGSDNAYPELPNAPLQMQDIKKYFPPDREAVFAREQASPAVYLKGAPEQFSYIHFVAHGTASRTSPLDSAIILSRDPASSASGSQDNSFKLYARDIIGGQPLHAELVTISACYSTGKRTYSGEGLVGLSWAFLRAGAHNVIGALWDVSDASTPQIMDSLYAELKKGKSPSAALRTAKLLALHGSDFKRPFYWAPFQLYSGQ